MQRMGVRELRQRASELLRQVESGEVIEITVRGRPVARLRPLPAGGPLQCLRDIREIEPATAGWDDLPEPMAIPEGQEPLSEALARLRADVHPGHPV
jgi:prevent-host-death family protein